MKVSQRKQAFEYFGEVAESYGNEHYQNYDQLWLLPSQFLQTRNHKRKAFYKIKPEKILDIGCEIVNSMKILIKEGFNVHGFDFSQRWF